MDVREINRLGKMRDALDIILENADDNLTLQTYYVLLNMLKDIETRLEKLLQNETPDRRGDA